MATQEQSKQLAELTEAIYAAARVAVAYAKEHDIYFDLDYDKLDSISNESEGEDWEASDEWNSSSSYC